MPVANKIDRQVTHTRQKRGKKPRMASLAENKVRLFVPTTGWGDFPGG